MEDMNLWLLDEDEILEEVDEYLLYCHYLGFQPELNRNYKSPIRPPSNIDTDPSFRIWEAKRFKNREFGWADYAVGTKGEIYSLVQHICKLKSYREAVAQVRYDFLIQDKANNLEKVKPFIPPPTKIRIKSKPFNAFELAWWKDNWGVTLPTLNRYFTTRLKYYFMTDLQVDPTFVNDLGFAYRVKGRYQLYFPERSHDKRWRNNLTDETLPGFEQLQYKSDTLIITKAFKDILVLAELGYEAVAPRGENILISQKFLDILSKRYKYIYILFDNDGKHSAHKYPFPLIQVPLESGEKDISDYRKRYGHDKAKKLLSQLTRLHWDDSEDDPVGT